LDEPGLQSYFILIERIGMKTLFKCLIIILPLFTFACKNDVETFAFHKDYKIEIPSNNYIVIKLRGFFPGNYLVVDMNTNTLRVYSPYKDKGLIFERTLSCIEIDSINEIFKSKEYYDLPNRNLEVVLDGEKLEVTSVINKTYKHLFYVIPENKLVIRIIDLYHEMNFRP
jgi:hypothetical protein